MGLKALGRNLRSWLGAARNTAIEAAHASSSACADVRVSARSNVGRLRATNEDAVGFHRPADERNYSRLGALAWVADGMGGVNGGELASRMVCDLVPRSYFGSRKAPPEALRDSLHSAGEAIYRKAQFDQALAGMGATCVALALRPPCAWAAWVGDSRLYLLRGGQIFQMTEDHSVVSEMVRNGLLDREAASRHSQRNVVTRALGSHAHVKIAFWEEAFPTRISDRFLLCSDGLHDLVSSAEILEIASTEAVDKACDGLIEAANEHGGHDNISAVLLEVLAAEKTPARAAPETRELVAAPST